ncbi:hypothetical protein [Paenibacillus glycinis]|uniref:Uncharacterized protein n=1 Tax=Paenibacillus glycinis TaxID=2697035 RepID=A0ABW9XKW7_9BACL|nr:hypothetical protein [Paenibacillus glycinis]NBD23141.1 hypothetical protein [Paenibacillus glycinis]
MKWEAKPDEPARSKLFTKDGKPLRILSTSMVIAMLASAVFGSSSYAADGTAAGDQPKLVEWSSDEVKTYFDPAVDWNIPLLEEDEEAAGTGTDPAAGTGAVSQGGGSGDTIIINNGGYSSGFGWDDLILYHLLFNGGSSYSTRSWSSSHTTYYAGTSTPYKTKSYSSGNFQNKPVVGSTVHPKTTAASGTITRRSSSSKPGGIGGTSSGVSSSGSSSSKPSSVFSSSKSSSSGSSSSSHSSGGFGG